VKRGPKIFLLSYGVLLLALGVYWPWLYEEAVWRAKSSGIKTMSDLIYGSLGMVLAMVVHLAVMFRKRHAWPYRIVVVGLVLFLAYVFFKYPRHPSETFQVLPVLFTLVLGMSFWRHCVSAWLCRFTVAGVSTWLAINIFKDLLSSDYNRSLNVFVLLFCAGNCATCLPLIPARHLERIGFILHQTWLFLCLYGMAREMIYQSEGDRFKFFSCGLYAAEGAFFALYCFRMYDLRVMFDRQTNAPQIPSGASV
jgi:isoprenylcysteine carboxyl methyltransferase (ICMT) family protein YpbQ